MATISVEMNDADIRAACMHWATANILGSGRAVGCAVIVGVATENSEAPNVVVVVTVEPGSGKSTAPKAKQVKRTEGVPFGSKWIAAFRDLHENTTTPYSYAEISSAAGRQGCKSNDGSLRAQMMKAVDSGLFERIGGGNFILTDSGLAMIMAAE